MGGSWYNNSRNPVAAEQLLALLHCVVGVTSSLRLITFFGAQHPAWALCAGSEWSLGVCVVQRRIQKPR